MKSKALTGSALVVATMLGAGCGSEFAPPSLVAGLRLLAVRADPPYMPLDGSKEVALDAKVVGVPAGESLCHAWAICLFAAATNGQYGCVDPSLQVDLGTAPTATAKATDLFQLFASAQEYAKKFPQTSASGPAAGKPPSAAGSASKIKVLYGVGQASAWGGKCPATASEFLAKGCPDRDRCVLSTTSLVIDSDGKSVHANPVLEGVTVDGATLADGATATVSKTGDVKIAPVWSQPDKATKPAGVVFSWFATDGEYGNERSYDGAPGTTWLAEKATGTEVRGWVVAHDTLGGVAWSSFVLNRNK
jgi:hypothetical protein